MQKTTKSIIDYYHTKESKWGYKVVLGGVKHFGFYPEKKSNISMHRATINMMQKLGETLNLKENDFVLDAGCGEGATAEYISKTFNLNVEGIDLLDFNINAAKKRTTNPRNTLNFNVGDYSHLDYPDNHFEAVYTLETLVHSPDYKVALSEFMRVLKPGGKLVLFEYSMPSEDQMSPRESWVFKTINEGSAMHSYPHFIHGTFPIILKEAGFIIPKVKDITAYMVPMLKRFYMLGILPYQVIKLMHLEKKYVNATSGVELYKHRNIFRYNIVTAVKPNSKHTS